jgi:hypothetical protein
MKAFVAGLAIAAVLAVVGGLVYGYVPITASEYFSTDSARLQEGMPEVLRGEEGQR